MSLYIGSNTATADFIAGGDQLKSLVREIADRYLKPIVGEIKFVPKYTSSIVGLTTSGSYKIPDDTFRGWVWADGSKFRSQDFPTASELYSTNDSTEFSVPTIDSFLKGSFIGNQFYTSQNSCVEHAHAISQTGSLGEGSTITIDNGLVFASAERAGDSDMVTTTVGEVTGVQIPRFHHGKIKDSRGTKKYRYVPVPLDISLKLSDYKLFFGDATTDYREYNPDVFSPASQRLATMIYIGKKGE